VRNHSNALHQTLRYNIFSQTLVRPATAVVSFIASMVQQMFHLPLHLREVHLLNSIRLFMRKASMLAAYVDSKMCVFAPPTYPLFAGISILYFKFQYFCCFIFSIHFEFCVKFTHRCPCSGTQRRGIRHRFRAAPLAASASTGGAWGTSGTSSTPGGGGADDASSASAAAAAFAAMAAAAAAPVSASAGELLQLRRETCEQLAIDSDDDLVRSRISTPDHG
jgi:hypothetical protein